MLVFIALETLLISLILSSSESIAAKVLITIFATVTNYLLCQLALEDLKEMEVSAAKLYLLIGVLLGVNFIMFLAGTESVILWGNTSYIAGANLLGGLVAALVVTGLFILTRSRGIGEGDIYLAAIMGLLLGLDKLLIGFYVMVIISLVYVGFLWLKSRGKESLRKKKVPLGPFIIAAVYLTLLLWPLWQGVGRALFLF